MSPAGIAKHRRTPHIHIVLSRETQYGTRELRFQFLGTITEISLRGTYMRGIRHRVFTASGKSENAVWQLFSHFRINYVVHIFNSIKCFSS